MRLPRESLRDYINELNLNLKFKWTPFRLHYRLRAYHYMYHIDPEMGLLRFLVDPTRVSLDVGANLGLFTYFLARYSPHVYAFEPNPLPYNVLKDIVDSNVTVYPMALTEATGEVELIVAKRRKGWTNNGATLEPKVDGKFIAVQVPGRRIDDLGIQNIGFIKIDVEGHERSVLSGAVETLRHDRPALFIENEYVHKEGAAQAVFDLLNSLDYDGFFLSDTGLQNLSQFSFREYQIKPREDSNGAHRYVKNFVFIPR
jgi:FkbM family methyltransferase